jgi:hypothetical protein
MMPMGLSRVVIGASTSRSRSVSVLAVKREQQQAARRARIV